MGANLKHGESVWVAIILKADSDGTQFGGVWNAAKDVSFLEKK